MDGHDTSGSGLEVVFGPAGEGDRFAGVFEEFVLVHLEFHKMVEMHGVEQAFDDREALDIYGTEGRIDGRPCRPDKRIGGDAGRHKVVRQRTTGGRFMVEAEVGRQRILRVRFAERTVGGVFHSFDRRHGGELVAGDGDVADACGVGEHAIHMFRQAVAVHDREQTGFGAVDVERDHDVTHGMLGGAAVRIVVPVGVEVDVEIVLFDVAVRADLTDFIIGVAVIGAVRRIGHKMADPGDVRRLADELLGASRGTQLREGTQVFRNVMRGDALHHGRFEPAEDVGHRLVDGGDAGNGDRPRNDTHRIGGVAGVLRLP